MGEIKPADQRFSLHTDRLPPERRLSAFRESYATLIKPCRIDALGDDPFWSSIDGVQHGDTTIAAISGSPMRWITERRDAERNAPAFLFDLLFEGHYSLRQHGRASLLDAGDAVLIHSQLPVLAVIPTIFSARSVVVPQTVAGSAFGDVDRLAGVHLPGHTVEMRLLASYLASIDLVGPIEEPAMRAMIGRHVTDLVLAVIARALRRDDPGEGRGVKAARLAENRRLILENLGQSTLNAARVARQLGVTERYVQKLVEESGTTFSAYVMERRLEQAHKMLAEDRDPSLAVRDIAWSLGFSDASHFTRAFRQRFGETPTAVRGTARSREFSRFDPAGQDLD